jgi:hypothetical protein
MIKNKYKRIGNKLYPICCDNGVIGELHYCLKKPGTKLPQNFGKVKMAKKVQKWGEKFEALKKSRVEESFDERIITSFYRNKEGFYYNDYLHMWIVEYLKYNLKDKVMISAKNGKIVIENIKE